MSGGPQDTARADALESKAEARADAWMYVTEADEDYAEDRWSRKGVI